MVHYIPSLLVITIPSGDVYSFILDVEGYPSQFFTIATAFGLIWLRFRRPDLKRPYKAWLPAVILRIGLSLCLIAAPFFPPPKDQRPDFFYATYALVGISMYVRPHLRIIARACRLTLSCTDSSLASFTGTFGQFYCPRPGAIV
jgi:amino acid transporter